MADRKSNKNMKGYAEYVPFSARLTAAKRAVETERTDSLFCDPYAKELAGEEALQTIRTRADSIFDSHYVTVRTRYFDDNILKAVQQGGITQVVLLGSGLDARAYRMAWPEGVTVYEMDFKNMLDYKATVLKDVQPKCVLKTIAGDISKKGWEERLVGQGFNATRRSLWLLEGVLMYLKEEDATQVINVVSSVSREGSWLGFDTVNVKATQGIGKGYFTSGWNNPKEVVRTYGYEAQAREPTEEDISFGRQPIIPPETGEAERVFLVIATKRDVESV